MCGPVWGGAMPVVMGAPSAAPARTAERAPTTTLPPRTAATVVSAPLSSITAPSVQPIRQDSRSAGAPSVRRHPETLAQVGGTLIRQPPAEQSARFDRRDALFRSVRNARLGALWPPRSIDPRP